MPPAPKRSSKVFVAPPLLILATGAFATGWLAFRGASFTALWVGGASLAAASVTHSAARLVQRGICAFATSGTVRRAGRDCCATVVAICCA